jgi:hypothetical protein
MIDAFSLEGEDRAEEIIAARNRFRDELNRIIGIIGVMGGEYDVDGDLRHTPIIGTISIDWVDEVDRALGTVRIGRHSFFIDAIWWDKEVANNVEPGHRVYVGVSRDGSKMLANNAPRIGEDNWATQID